VITQLSRACGVSSQLKYYTKQSVLKVVYSSFFAPTLLTRSAIGDVLQA